MNHFAPPRMPSSLRGIIVPLATPILAQDTLDLQGLERLIDHVIYGGVHGVMLLSPCGEGPSLSPRLKREVIARACQLVRGRVPVLVGVTDCSFTESLLLADAAYEAHATAVVLATPYYFAPGQAEMVSYVRHLHDELPLPLVLHKLPHHSRNSFEAWTIEQLLDLPKLAGLCDSSGDLDVLRELKAICRHRPDLSLLTGAENLLGAALELGSCGGLAEGANLFPELFVGWYDAIHAGDFRRAAGYQCMVDQLQSIYRIGQGQAAVVKSVKAGLAHFHLCGDLAAEPFQPLEEPENAAISSILEGIEHQFHSTPRPMKYQYS